MDVLSLMLRLEGLKRTARTGWNKKFPPGHRFKSRTVKDAESVADHSWSLAMFALAEAQERKLDASKIVWMALIHDVAEIITLDIVTATELDPVERKRLEAEKRGLEDQAMRDIFLPMGSWGNQCYELWLEYEEQRSPEARTLKELDKLEACVQALLYREQGQEVDPNEYFDETSRFLGPDSYDSVALLARIRMRAGMGPT